MSQSTKETVKVALAGQPNAGKTSVFNALTGARRRVANYPGVTVEKRESEYEYLGRTYQVTDLPGTYSLSSFSPEERIAQDELLDGSTDVVVVVVDSSTLQRSLVFLAQVMHLGSNLVLCLNMADEARKAGQRLDVPLMSSLLGFPVVETVGHRAEGMDRLKEAIRAAADSPTHGRERLVLGERLTSALEGIEHALEATGMEERLQSWTAVRLLVGDDYFVERVAAYGEAGQAAIREADEQRRHLESTTGQDAPMYVMERYYGFVDGLLRECMRSRPTADARIVSDRIDAVLANRFLGLPVFLFVMFGIFWLTFRLGNIPMGWIEAGFNWMSDLISAAWPQDFMPALRSLLVDGIIGGVGGVVVFVPNIVLLFLGLAILEDTGYMARAAFLVDRLMHRFGLHGKSFLPMVTGFGCTIPGIMATRTLENERDRLTTMLVLPLMSCGARLPIWLLLIPAFFPAQWQAPMLWFIYFFGILLALVLALLLRRTILKGEEPPFVMELPPYRLPTAKGLLIKMGERSLMYLRKAGTVILAISVVMWAVTSYPKPDTYEIDSKVARGEVVVVEVEASSEAEAGQSLEQARRAHPGAEVITQDQFEARRAAEGLRHSLAGRIGRAVEPLFRPLGFDWRLVTAMMGAFAAKEVFVAQMGIVYSLGDSAEGSDKLRQDLARDYSPLTGLALMLFLLIGMPCMATVAVTRRESGSWRWAMIQFWGLSGVAYLVALVVYQAGSLLGLG